MKLLLHACCGPCSLEPVRLLQQAGHDLTIAFMNSNIHPEAEYDQRLSTLYTWALTEGIPVIEGVYNPTSWEDSAGAVAANPVNKHEDRCRACYRLRFEEAAQYAVANGFDALATTLTVSPYQCIQIIREELEAAGQSRGIETVFEDFRPFYDDATYRSRTLGMYRQNYCGCRLSAAEAATERAERKRTRDAEKAAKRTANIERDAAEAHALAVKRAEKQAHAAKQAEKRRALKAFRQVQETTAPSTQNTSMKEENNQS